MRKSRFSEEQITMALRQTREENRKLKGIVADLTLDRTILQEALRKKW